MVQQPKIINTPPIFSGQAKRGSTHQHEVVFRTLDAFLSVLENAEVMICKITQNVVSHGRSTGVSQRQYGVHLTALGPQHGRICSQVYYCTILVVSQSVLANRPFCPSPEARSQHESCLHLHEQVYQQLVTLLQARANVSRVIGEARILVNAPWVELIGWDPGKDLSLMAPSDTSFLED